MTNNQKKSLVNQKLNDSKIDFGVTTGSIATATSLAALERIIHPEKDIDFVRISTPFDELDVIIEKSSLLSENKAESIGVKYPYNDPDVTVNLKIISSVELLDKPKYNNKSKSRFKSNIIIEGGIGVGTVTKPGLQIPIGKPAINPTPLEMIEKNLNDLVPNGKIAKVTISVPDGEKIAKKTMNPKLGIVGGISILGTTGIARAMSSKAYKDSLICQMDIAMAMIKESNYTKDDLIFVPGNIGEKLALENLVLKNNEMPIKEQIIQTGNYVGFMLSYANKIGINKLILYGHIGKLVKLASGIFNTKHSVADGRREVIATHAGLCGADKETIESVFNSKNTEEMIEILRKKDIDKDVLNSISLTIKKICLERFNLEVKVILVDMQGNQLNSM